MLRQLLIYEDGRNSGVLILLGYISLFVSCLAYPQVHNSNSQKDELHCV